MMRPSRNRLNNAVRRSMIQRAELQRKLGIARDALHPKALIGRGKYRIGKKVDDTALAVKKQFRANRLPLGLAAAAGIVWLFREPIKEHAPRIGRKIRDIAEAGMARIRPGVDDGAGDDEFEQDDFEHVEELDETAE